VKWVVLVTLALVAAACSDSANTQYLPIGSRCSSSSQCGTMPYDCAATGYPFGYCEKPCITDGDCPADSLCSPTAKACRRVCTTSADCRIAEGYVCQQLISGKSVCESGGSMDGGSP
jgi:hypothetical protein